MDVTDNVLKQINRTEVVDILGALIRLNSVNPPGNESPVAHYMAESLKEAGLEARTTPLAEGRANVVARLRGRGSVPALMFCGHLDTVHPGESTWQHNPFGAEMVDGRLYGRGTSDMKGGVAAMIAAVAALGKARLSLGGDVIVWGTAGEEVDCLGARHLLANEGLKGVGALVVPEPTGLTLVTAHRGAVWLELTTRGKAAHGSMPELGINAILHMYELLERLLRHDFRYEPHPLLRPPTVNVGTLSGGTKTNVVPELCKATVDIRTVPSQSAEGILEEIQGLIVALNREVPDFHAHVEVIRDARAVTTDTGTPLVRVAQQVAHQVLGQTLEPRGVDYFTDASVLSPPTGVPTLICGPGDAAMAHQTDEYVEIDNVVQAARFYAALALELLGSGGSD
jgi:succinyl-diaminopimelate desuccinylase